MSIKSLLTNRAETSENHPEEKLKTHYFKVPKDRAMKQCAETLLKNGNCELLSESPERGEMVFKLTKPKKALIVVTVISVQAFRTAIDFSVSTETPLPVDFGFSRKFITNTYDELKKQLPYIGTGIAEQI
ncbi:cytosolic protein [Pseudalkalibacillus caeni]|uniref:Cytosolic protein n=1 Tax=Exobacillus caeni TaxID=2574798 RepID=A0A5R9FE48_9BACL|nr:cytosolic protein [Pseudalkalibacillus caeni]TLS39153.1 cytosolic protein [Pseudalkalibacillus caeni]